AMITKAEVRALELARLGPGLGRTVWDIGAGSGSVAVGGARVGARGYAVEGDQGQCERGRRHAAAHRGGGRIPAVAGTAPPGGPGRRWRAGPRRTRCSPAAAVTTCWPPR